MSEHTNNYPKLHNATWPGVVGKGSGDGEPIIPLDTLLKLTANAEYEGQKFDGVDLWLADPHISIDSSQDDIKRVAHHIASFGLKVGSFVAPIWGGAGGGSAMACWRANSTVGLLSAMEIAPFVLFSLPSGVWLDRVRKLPVYATGETLLALSTAQPPMTSAASSAKAVIKRVLGIHVLRIIFFSVRESSLKVSSGISTESSFLPPQETQTRISKPKKILIAINF